jgi:hypothetical protein
LIASGAETTLACATGMSVAALLPSSTSLSLPTLKQSATFEFTKRKRWKDLLFTELADAFVLILSAAYKILYCGSAVSEMLGWKDRELIDCDLFELIHRRSQSAGVYMLLIYLPADDHDRFRLQFDNSMRTNNDLLAFAHLKTKANSPTSPEHHTTSQIICFELKGRPVSLPETNILLVVAKPYPSRNTEM